MPRDRVAMWAARRAVCESSALEPEILARAFGVSAAWLAAKARREGWRSGAGPLPIGVRIRNARLRLLDSFERRQGELSATEAGAYARVLDKLGDDLREGEDGRALQASKDEDLADVLERLDRQIVDLARHLAQVMAGVGIHGG